MNRNLNRRIHPTAEADGLSPKKPRKVGDCISWQGVNKVYSGVVEQRINEQTIIVRLPNNKYIQVYDCDNEHRTIEVSVPQGEGDNQQHEVRQKRIEGL